MLEKKLPDGSPGQTMAQLAEQIEIHASELEKQRADLKAREERLNNLIVAQDERMAEVRKIALNGHANPVPADDFARLGMKLGELGLKPENHGVIGYLQKSWPRGNPKSIGDAILAIWDLPAVRRMPVNTGEIIACLPKVGYKSSAKRTSLKSSVNQALARLSADKKVVRLRVDGSVISRRDGRSRARCYQRADLPLPVSERPRE